MISYSLFIYYGGRLISYNNQQDVPNLLLLPPLLLLSPSLCPLLESKLSLILISISRSNSKSEIVACFPDQVALSAEQCRKGTFLDVFRQESRLQSGLPSRHDWPVRVKITINIILINIKINYDNNMNNNNSNIRCIVFNIPPTTTVSK